MQNLLLLGLGGAAILGGWAFKRLLGANSAKSPKILKGIMLGKDDWLILIRPKCENQPPAKPAKQSPRAFQAARV